MTPEDTKRLEACWHGQEEFSRICVDDVRWLIAKVRELDEENERLATEIRAFFDELRKLDIPYEDYAKVRDLYRHLFATTPEERKNA